VLFYRIFRRPYQIEDTDNANVRAEVLKPNQPVKNRQLLSRILKHF
jgi:hypothetical protein